MSDKPRRAWFQIHLSTAIVLMFVAGGFVGLNMNPRKVLKFSLITESRIDYKVFGQIGWPMATIEYTNGGGIASESEQAEDHLRNSQLATLADFFNIGDRDWPLPNLSYNYFGIAFNIVAFVFVLVVLAAGIEFLNRRREARAP